MEIDYTSLVNPPKTNPDYEYDLLIHAETGARGCFGVRDKYKKSILSDKGFEDFLKKDEEITKNIESLLKSKLSK